MIQFKKLRNKEGLSLVELMVSVMILLPLFAVGMQTFIRCIELSDAAKNSSLALAGIRNRITAIENTLYADIYDTYNNTTFSITGLTGIGKTYVDNTSPDHVTLDIEFCWKERQGRVIGEDKDLDGTLDAGEDSNGNGKLSSLVEIETQIYDR